MIAAIGALLGTVACLQGCSSDCMFDKTCASSDGGDGSADGPNDAGGDAACDPKTQMCVLDGIFVSAAGKPDGAGTKTDPISVITNALAKAKMTAKTNIYVCEGSYPGSIDIVDLIAINGGFKCADWSYTGARPTIQADKPAYAAKVTASNVTLTDLVFAGKDGSAKGESSVGLFASSVQGLLFRRVRVEAGKGAAGDNGTLTPNYIGSLMPDDVKIAGLNATGINGGGAQQCNQAVCVDGAMTTGGSGGQGTLAPANGGAGTPNLGGMAPKDGAGGTAALGCGGGQAGHDGANGDAGAPAPAATVLGVLDASGWKPANGPSGVNGHIAQGGGGGGGGVSMNNGGGGGGGCGGCGGAGGAGGQGGGASIALLSRSSIIKLEASELKSSDAGAGGAGIAGQAGQIGGAGGTQASLGCPGGQGGTGGVGGSSGGGAGGVSAGVVLKGAMNDLVLDSMTTSAIMLGMKGAKGAGGQSPTNDGPDGTATPIYVVQ